MSKYYTPEIEEFHVGFIYEHSPNHIDWVEMNIPATATIDYRVFPEEKIKKKYRVKHLDREDIEGEGWRFTHRHQNTYDEYYYTDGEYGDYYVREHNGPNVHDAPWFSIGEIHVLHGDLFRGKIKNLSEFRRILKQIGV